MKEKENEFQTVTTGVFDRDGYDTISAQSFYLIMAGVLFWGLFGTALLAYIAIKIGFMTTYIPCKPWIILIGLGLVVPIIGIIIAIKSSNPFLSFLGYNLIVIPFGFLLGPVVNQYQHDSVMHVFGVTAGITIFMGFMGTIFPNFFSKIGHALLLALFGLVLVMIAQLFIPQLNLGIIDYIGAGIFTLYIGYDMYRANNMPKTPDNALDICVDLYLDIINLFLFLLRIMGKKS
jgi:FtsH-binding integral membrane protein